MSVSSDLDPIYHTRYSWRALDVWIALASVCVAATAVASHDHAVPSLFAVVAVAMAGGYPLLRMVQMRQVALRVDAAGITFGWPSWPWSRSSPTVTVPWSDITAVVLWGHSYLRSVQFIGVVRREGAPPLPRALPRPVDGFTSDALAPYTRALDRVSCGFHVTSWRPDPERMTAAVRRHAPGVEVVDAY